jgi:tetratricopeptide (TPR) repeat protein
MFKMARSRGMALFLFLRTVSAWAQNTPPPFLTPDDERLLAHAADLQKAGRDSEALAAVDQFTAAVEKRVAAPDFRLALVYSLATAVWRMDLASADKYYDKALRMAKSTVPQNNQKLLFAFFSTYAWCKLREDQYSQAKELLDQAADVALSDLLSTTFHMGADFRQAGDFVRSEWVFRYLLKQLEPVADTQHEILAGIYNQLGILLAARGDVEEAKSLYQTAITDAEKAFGPTSPKMQPFLFNLGQLYEKHEQYADAEKLYQRALSNSESNSQDGDGLASNLSNLGVLYLKLDKKQEGKDLIERAVEIRRAIRQDTGLAALLINLASACAALGDDEIAERHYKEALDIAMKYADTDRTAMTVMAELGSFYLDRNQKPAADALLARAGAMNEKGLTELDPDRADWFTTVATTYLTHGNCNLSLSYLQRGDSVWDRNLALLMTAGTQEQRQQYLDQSDIERHVAVSIHNHCFPDREDVARFAYESVLQHKARGVDAFADQLGAMRLRGTPEEKELLRQYAGAVTVLAASRPGGAQDPTTTIRNLETEISARSADFRSLRNRPSFEALRQAIPAGEVLIEFFAQVDVKPASEEMTNRYMAYVTRRERSAPMLVELATVNQIDAAASHWRLCRHSRTEALTSLSSQTCGRQNAELRRARDIQVHRFSQNRLWALNRLRRPRQSAPCSAGKKCGSPVVRGRVVEPCAPTRLPTQA